MESLKSWARTVYRGDIVCGPPDDSQVHAEAVQVVIELLCLCIVAPAVGLVGKSHEAGIRWDYADLALKIFLGTLLRK